MDDEQFTKVVEAKDATAAGVDLGLDLEGVDEDDDEEGSEEEIDEEEELMALQEKEREETLRAEAEAEAASRVKASADSDDDDNEESIGGNTDHHDTQDADGAIPDDEAVVGGSASKPLRRGLEEEGLSDNETDGNQTQRRGGAAAPIGADNQADGEAEPLPAAADGDPTTTEGAENEGSATEKDKMKTKNSKQPKNAAYIRMLQAEAAKARKSKVMHFL